MAFILCYHFLYAMLDYCACVCVCVHVRESSNTFLLLLSLCLLKLNAKFDCASQMYFVLYDIVVASCADVCRFCHMAIICILCSWNTKYFQLLEISVPYFIGVHFDAFFHFKYIQFRVSKDMLLILSLYMIICTILSAQTIFISTHTYTHIQTKQLFTNKIINKI